MPTDNGHVRPPDLDVLELDPACPMHDSWRGCVMIEHVRYGDGTVRPVNETTRASHAPSVILRDPLSGDTLTVDARLTCIPSDVKHRGAAALEDSQVDRRELVEISEITKGSSVYIDDPLGGTWRRFDVVGAAHGGL